MNRRIHPKLLTAILLLVIFTLWTLMLWLVDIRPVGPLDSAVGLGSINSWFHKLTGVNMTLYEITDWLGLVPIAIAFGFAVLGLCQWIRRKHLLRVDTDLWLLGGFYIVVILVYALFEEVVINYRPVLINGILEASYPSSTTVLVMCVVPTARLFLLRRIQHVACRRIVSAAAVTFMTFMVVGRVMSGVHWLSDIVGGLILSAGLVTLYDAACCVTRRGKDTV